MINLGWWSGNEAMVWDWWSGNEAMINLGLVVWE